MTGEKVVDAYYQRQAKDFIDLLHDKGYFRTDVRREEMQGIENLLAYFYESHCNMAVRSSELLARTKKTSDVSP